MDIKKTSTIHFEDFVLNIYENIHNVILFKEQEILDIFGLKFFVNCNYKKYHINVISLNTEYCIFELYIFAFIFSHNMVGGFGRILNELDEIIDGNSKKTISSRPHDTLTKELLKRVNLLVEFYVKHNVKDS